MGQEERRNKGDYIGGRGRKGLVGNGDSILGERSTAEGGRDIKRDSPLGLETRDLAAAALGRQKAEKRRREGPPCLHQQRRSVTQKPFLSSCRVGETVVGHRKCPR